MDPILLTLTQVYSELNYAENILFLLFGFSWKKESQTHLTGTSLTLTCPSVEGKDSAQQELSEEHRLQRDNRLGEKAETFFQDKCSRAFAIWEN